MGIDYGRGLTNIDHNTGIRYGVIPANDVTWWHESCEPIYPDFECECEKSVCPDCGADCESEFTCDDCGDFECECGDFWDCVEPLGFEYVGEGIEATEDSHYDIFVTKSPYYTLCNFCSPCAPGAGYLTSKGDVKAYCFPPDWFDVCPYDVYSVESGELIHKGN